MQMELFHEDIYEALRTVIQAAGGAKRVGAELWPEMAADKAGNRLNDCINPGRSEQLSLEQLLFILAKGREAGCHSAMWFVADHCDYRRPEPTEPTDEIAQLQKDFIQAQQEMARMLKRMEHFSHLKAVS